MRFSRPVALVVLLLVGSALHAQVAPSLIGTHLGNSPAKLKFESRMDYVSASPKVIPFAIQVKATFDLNLDTTSATWPMIFTGAGTVTHPLLDISGFQSVLPPQCSVSLTASDGSMVARIRYNSGGDPVLEIGNLGSILETLTLGGYCAVAIPPRNLWGAPYAVLHENEMSGAGYYQFSMKEWTQIGPLTTDGPVTFFKDYVQSTATIGNEVVVPLVPVDEVREITHVEFTIYARSPVNQPSESGRRRAARH